MDYKRFRVPNRDVKLTEEFEVAVACTRTFQRLFYLKQLGLAHLVYPCAAHTRAGHSIECLDEATKIMDSLGIREGKDGWMEVRMAALLHDIGHIPFSHTLEDENEVLPKHDKGERLERVLGNLKKEIAKEVAALVEKATPILMAISTREEKRQDWRSDLVGNTVCADLLAYIITDAAWTGIEKRPGYYRIYDYFRIADKQSSDGTKQERLCIGLTKGGLRMDVVSAILDLMDMRYALTERVIYHHAKAMASAMLARACRLCGLRDLPILLDMGDERFLEYLDRQADECGDRRAGVGAKALLEHLRSRRLYKRIFKVQREAMEEWNRKKSKDDNDTFCARWRNGPMIEETLAKIEDRFNLPRGTLVLWCPEGRSGMKLVEVNVAWDQPGGIHPPVKLRSEDVQRQFPAVHRRVETIERQYLGLWTFWVGIHPEHIRDAPGVIAALSSELEIECDPVFIETYAKTRLEGFAESARLQATLEDTWQAEVMPEVSQKILDVAARPGGEVDSAVITEAIHAVSAQKRQTTKKTEKRRTSEQPKLPGVDEKGDVLK